MKDEDEDERETKTQHMLQLSVTGELFTLCMQCVADMCCSCCATRPLMSACVYTLVGKKRLKINEDNGTGSGFVTVLGINTAFN